MISVAQRSAETETLNLKCKVQISTTKDLNIPKKHLRRIINMTSTSMKPNKTIETLVRSSDCGTESSDDLKCGTNTYTNITDSQRKQTTKCDGDNSYFRKNKGLFTFLRAWEKKMGFHTELIWKNVMFISLLHLTGVVWFGYNLVIGYYPKWQSLVYAYVIANVAGFGVTAGVHRYWCHRSYRAALPLRWILVICYSIAGQNTIYDWVRDHRVHHKYSDTPSDPHNAHRGFFFSHVGWLMMRKHPDVIKRGQQIDMSDIANDLLVQFHTKYFKVFKITFCFVLPTLVPPLAWGESWDYAILSQVFLRYIYSINCTWSVNSFAHLWGNKPYDPELMPAENWLVSVVALGEGWHNYHHTFPWDYKAAELAYSINFTTLLLDGFAKLGWAYNFKQASPKLVQDVARNRNKHKSEHHNVTQT